MTTPTQAQIEAAAKAIENVRRCGRFSSCEELAEAALTAAAEAGETNEQMLNRWDAEDEAARKAAIRATIERCAQVAAAYIKEITGYEYPGLAAAIRAMKDH